MTLKLVIGNKNYSSWSMRPWLALRANNIAFEEVFIPLYTGAADKQRILDVTPFGQGAGADRWRHHGLGFAGHHRICRRAVSAERGCGRRIAPARAHARSISAEMHSGFMALRNECGMNLHRPVRRDRAVGRCARQHRAHRADLDRMPSSATASPGRFCSGRSAAPMPCSRRWCIAFAPMRSRWRPRRADYMKTMMALPAFHGMDPRGPRRNHRDREIRDGLTAVESRVEPLPVMMP